MENSALFSLLYLPPIEFFKEILTSKDKSIVLEKFEHFPKQTYRNRASIYGANGKLNLTVPIIKGANKHTIFKDIKISYEDNWQRIHWLSLQSAYRSSSYFEFYEDDYAPFYERKFNYLFDYNLELLNLIIKQLKVNVDIKFTETFEKEFPENLDYRNKITPKIKPSYLAKEYYQVFDDKYGFIPNLSIVDLIFNQGPQAIKFI